MIPADLDFESWTAAVNRCLTVIGNTIESTGMPMETLRGLHRDGVPAGYAAKECAHYLAVASSAAGRAQRAAKGGGS